MGHCSCINGHSMWNGDGKPLLWVFRLAYFRNYMKKNPECILSWDDMQIYDCYCEHSSEELDCWFCDECGSIVVYADNYRYRYDYVKTELTNEACAEALADWEDCVAMRNAVFELFQDWYEGKDPLTALEKYEPVYRCKLSPDKKTVYVVDRDNKAVLKYEQKRALRPDK